MTFGEKLKKLRTDNHLTQDELAEKLYVTRTAISKWETDKGYPSIDSIRVISKFFSVTIDELLSTDEVFTIAEQDSKRQEKQFLDIIFAFLDLGAVLFLFLPFFAYKTDGIIQSATLLTLYGIQQYLKIAYFVVVIGLIVCGALTLAFKKRQTLFAMKIKNIVSLIFSTAAVLLFIISSQPYAAIFAFVLMAIKAIILIKHK